MGDANSLACRVAVVRGDPDYRDPAAILRQVESVFEKLQLPADYVVPGHRVVLKPNWVKEHDERHPGPDQWEQVVTHPAVIEAVAMWVGERLDGKGTVTICDAPQTDSSFATLRKYCDLDGMITRCSDRFPGVLALDEHRLAQHRQCVVGNFPL